MRLPTLSKDEDSFGFPVQAFHRDLQSIIDELSSHGFNQDLVSCTMLSVLAAAIGSSYKVQCFEPDHTEPAILWIALVARSGGMKSATLNALTKPLHDIHWKQCEAYQRDKEAWENSPDDQRSGSRPKRIETMIKGFTLEGVVKSAVHNPKGSLILVDEFLSMLANLNKYNRGSDLEIILSFHDGSGYSSTLATRDGDSVKSTCFNILGGIQYRRLKRLLTPENINSGFANRILFAAPEITAPPPNDTKADQQIRDRYAEIIKILHGIEPDKGCLGFEAEAREDLKHWLTENRNRINKYNQSDKDLLAEVLSKFEAMLYRIALVLQVSDDVCSNTNPKDIRLDTFRKAIHVIDYFMEATTRIYGLNDLPDELLNKPAWQIDMYRKLESRFETKDAYDINKANPNQVSEKTVREFIGNPQLFRKISHGSYEKRAV